MKCEKNKKLFIWKKNKIIFERNVLFFFRVGFEPISFRDNPQTLKKDDYFEKIAKKIKKDRLNKAITKILNSWKMNISYTKIIGPANGYFLSN